MSRKPVWLFDHKASLSEDSPMNMDGSTWLTGICVLTADDEAAASAEFEKYLSVKGMALLELFELSEYSPDRFPDSSGQAEQVNNAVRLVLQGDGPCYVCARTSEYYEAMNEDQDDA